MFDVFLSLTMLTLFAGAALISIRQGKSHSFSIFTGVCLIPDRQVLNH